MKNKIICLNENLENFAELYNSGIPNVLFNIYSGVEKTSQEIKKQIDGGQLTMSQLLAQFQQSKKELSLFIYGEGENDKRVQLSKTVAFAEKVIRRLNQIEMAESAEMFKNASKLMKLYAAEGTDQKSILAKIIYGLEQRELKPQDLVQIYIKACDKYNRGLALGEAARMKINCKALFMGLLNNGSETGFEDALKARFTNKHIKKFMETKPVMKKMANFLVTQPEFLDGLCQI